MILESLRNIVQAVSVASNLEEALAVIVQRVKSYLAVDVCSVYLIDEDAGQYVLMASDGLNPASVGKIRLDRTEGLVGLVGRRQEPINLERASQHPDYRYFPESEEERYCAFLGVPLMYLRNMLGVLVIQQGEQRLFQRDEVSFLVTIAAQLAGVLSNQTAGNAIGALLHGDSKTDTVLQGLSGAPGLGIGTVVLPSPFANLASVPDRNAQDARAEEAAFNAAVTAFQEELRAASERIAQLVPADAQGIFDAYAMFLDNDWLYADTVKRVRSGQWAPGAWRETILEHARIFERMEDPYLRERSEDIRAIGRRVLMHLRSDATKPRDYPDRCILVGEEVSVAWIANMPIERLAGIVALRSSTLSHSAILARGLGIPAVMGIGDIKISRLEGTTVVVDGRLGRVFTHPSPAVLNAFGKMIEHEETLSVSLASLRELPAETQDGTRLPLYANTGLLTESVSASRTGAEGIGLYRTEFPFMLRESFPGEDEQIQLYREVLESVAPRPVYMRTLDIGGDKVLPYLPVDGESNPFLGWRGIRISLDHPELFRTQLRAMLRANIDLENLRVLFPMVSRVQELQAALALLGSLLDELRAEGWLVSRPAVGIMIEVPSAAIQAGTLAQYVDFLSIGSNDLAQYILAVDRGNPRVSALYDELHPAVLRTIQEVIAAAHSRGKPVSLCGEMAGDPAAALLLLGMGIDTLSMSVASLPRVKWAIRSFTRDQAHRLVVDALALESEAPVRMLVNDALEQAGLSELVHIAKPKHGGTAPAAS